MPGVLGPCVLRLLGGVVAHLVLAVIVHAGLTRTVFVERVSRAISSAASTSRLSLTVPVVASVMSTTLARRRSVLSFPVSVAS